MSVYLIAMGKNWTICSVTQMHSCSLNMPTKNINMGREVQYNVLGDNKQANCTWIEKKPKFKKVAACPQRVGHLQMQ